MPNLVVSSDVDTMLQSANNAAILSNIGAGSSTQVATNTSDIATNTSNISSNSSNISTNTSNISTNTANIATNTSDIATNTSNIATNTSNIATNTSNIATNASNIATNTTDIATQLQAISDNASNIALKASLTGATFTGNVNAPKIVADEIQRPLTSDKITYDSNEHRFRDVDENPDDLMVIKKLPSKAGGRVGINMDGVDPKCALHVINNTSDGYPTDEAIRCTGGIRVSKWIRLGQYTDSERDALGLDPPPGLMIYNEEHYEVQVFIANPSGSGRGSWKALTMQNVGS